jgi:RNA polymerase sigma-70 factor (ECF subfamily)
MPPAAGVNQRGRNLAAGRLYTGRSSSLPVPGTTDPTDHALVDAVIAGDKAQFAELVRRYEPLARAAAVGILKDMHLAQDVMQEAFLIAYTNLGKLADRSRFGPWVLKIARRQALRARSKRRLNDANVCADDLPADDGNERLDGRLSELLDAVSRLPDHEQLAVVMHYFEAHTAEVIAQMTGQTTGTVTKQLSRARRRLEGWLRKSDQ